MMTFVVIKILLNFNEKIILTSCFCASSRCEIFPIHLLYFVSFSAAHLLGRPDFSVLEGSLPAEFFVAASLGLAPFAAQQIDFSV
jgi:hypothetical protein